MNLEQTRLLLRSVSIGSCIGIPVVIAWMAFGTIATPEFGGSGAAVAAETPTESIPPLAALTLADFDSAFDKPLQNLMSDFDLDDDIPHVVKKAVVPLRVKIVATMVEPGRRAALISTGGRLQVRRAGEKIEDTDAEVVSVKSEEVVLRQNGELVTLKLPRTSKVP